MGNLKLLLAALATAAVAARPVRVILDTDIATDFDDTWALHLILSRPDVYDLKLVQTSTFNTTKRAEVAAFILQTLGRFDIPVAIGRYTGEQSYPQYPIVAANNFSLTQFASNGGVVLNGTDMMAEIMRSSTPEDPVLIVEIAPPTSLGDVLLREPSLANNCIAVAMSGSIYRGYENSSTPSAEYNVHEDISSAQRVYNASWLVPLVTAPTDTGIAMQFFGAAYQQLLAAESGAHPLAQSLLANYKAWYSNGGNHFAALQPFSPANGTSTLWDAQAAYMAGAFAGWRAGAPAPGSPAALPTFPSFTTQLLHVSVNGSGHTVLNQPGAQPVMAAVGFPDGFVQDIANVELDIISSIIAA